MTRAKDVFLDALDLPGEQRAAFVRKACGADDALRCDVDRLLAAHDNSTRIFGNDDTVNLSVSLQSGGKIGSYVLMDELGEGGFASVWRARQTEPVQRIVALKVLKAGMDTAEVVRRFEAEHQALAMMDHPGIAKVFDGGATDFGRPWFAMELVDGVPITTYAERHGLQKEARLELFLTVCRAVQHAHTKGVIHRDLKPSNILVAEVDGVAVATVIDFGIAKAIEQSIGDASIVTRAGQVVGTPAYMSPEQVDESVSVDTRCDVYALGVLLYELLAGQRPFSDETLHKAGLAEVLRIIREVEPPHPSACSKTTVVTSRELKGDLDWIVMRCLEKDRERRYDSADMLANEIDRHLAGEPVLAGPPDLGYRTRKFVGRHQVALSVVGIIAVVLVVGIVVALSQLFRAQAAEAAAHLAKEEALASAGQAREAEAVAHLAKEEAIASAGQAREAEAQARVESSKFQEISLFYEAVLTGVDPAVAKTEDTALLRRLLASADAWASDRFAASPQVDAVVRRAIGMAYLTLSRTDLAEPQLRRVVELRRASLGDSDPLLAQSLQELSVLLSRDERFDEAAPLLREAVGIFERAAGPEDERSLRTLGDLAVLLRGQGELDEAESLLRQLLQRCLAALGEDHDTTIAAINNLASVLEDLDELEEAATHHLWALDLQLAKHGELHPQALMSLNNVAAMMCRQGDLEAAVPVLERALEWKRRVFPPAHRSVVLALNNLGDTHCDLGRYDRARPYFEEALQLLEDARRSDSARGLMVRFNYAKMLDRTGDVEGALASYQRGMQQGEAAMGAGHPLVVAFHGAYGWALVKLGRAAEAEPILAAALARNLAVVPVPEARAAVGKIRLGVCLRDLGRLPEARAAIAAGLRPAREHELTKWVEIAEQALASLPQ